MPYFEYALLTPAQKDIAKYPSVLTWWSKVSGRPSWRKVSGKDRAA